MNYDPAVLATVARGEHAEAAPLPWTERAQLRARDPGTFYRGENRGHDLWTSDEGDLNQEYRRGCIV